MGEGERVLCTPSSHFAHGGVIVLPVCSFLFFVMFWGWYMNYISLKDKVPESDFYLLICFNKRPTTSLVEIFRAWVLLPGKVLTIPAISLLSLGTLSSALFPRELWWGELWYLRRFKRRFEQQSGWVTEAEQRTLKTEFMYLRGAKWQRTVVGKKVSWLRVLWDSKVSARYEGIKVSAGL